MQYIKDYMKSRGYSEGDYIPCEVCNTHAVDIHHINSSYRGKRKHSVDGSDLIALCRLCHDNIHSSNNSQNRERLLQIVANVKKGRKNS